MSEQKIKIDRATDGAVMTWDLTLKAEGKNSLQVAKGLKEIAKAWVFQLEESEETKYVHYQIRISLFKKKRLTKLIKLIKDTPIEGAHLSKTSNNGAKSMSYVMKKDTRKDGPWSDKDPDPETMDAELALPPNAFQAKMLALIAGAIDRRKIHVVVDELGNKGKTWLTKYLRYKKLATVIPSFDKMEDISQMVMCKPADRAYVIDMPRSIRPNRMQGFWSGIESIKNGYCYDKRNKFQDRVMATPHIIVLTNKTPNLEHLSKDRWDIITI